jgi:hypothetical protein
MMAAAQLGVRPRAVWRRWPRRTARLRFTAVYGGLFLLSGAALVAITYGLFERATRYTKPHLPQIPHPPPIAQLQLPGPLGQSLPQLPQALSQLTQDQNQLAQDQHRLVILSAPPPTSGTHPLTYPFSKGPLVDQLTRAQQQLSQDQHQLAQAVNQLAQAVHQVAQAGSIQAAQRASDSHQLLVNSAIALALAAVLALVAGWLVAGRVASSADHHPDGPADLLHQSAPASVPGRPPRRAQTAGGHPG